MAGTHPVQGPAAQQGSADRVDYKLWDRMCEAVHRPQKSFFTKHVFFVIYLNTALLLLFFVKVNLKMFIQYERYSAIYNSLGSHIGSSALPYYCSP